MNQGIFAIGMLVSRYFEPRFNACASQIIIRTDIIEVFR